MRSVNQRISGIIGRILILVMTIIGSAMITMCGKVSNSAKEDNLIADQKLSVFAKPFRVLVIIGDQWTDPQSYAIDGRRSKDEDFLDVINMLKIWGVPFDILRLDQQRLQINRFLDSQARPNYGCVIWMADPSKISGYSANYETLKRAVNDYGISMICLFDYIKNQQVADLAGIRINSVNKLTLTEKGEKLVASGTHFITAELGKIAIPDRNLLSFAKENPVQDAPDETSLSVINCTTDKSTETLGTIGDVPQLTVRDVNGDTKVIWIGGGHDWFRKYPVYRKIFRKALVYSIGYGLFNDDFENGFIFIMDDIGCADHSWFLRWHYPTPPKDTLIKYLIEPLEKRGLMMVQCITSGFLDLDQKIIVAPWTVKPFTDVFGNWQDYGSSKQGLDEGLRRGVFEIQHDRAWSHMNWDLDSPPGSFWEAPLDGQKNNGDWYNEVSDVTRGTVPVPSNDLLFLYRQGIDAVKKAFGVTPIDAEIYPSTDISDGTSAGNDNGRIAAIAGLGIGRDAYVGFDHTIEFKMMLPEQFTCHDLDLTMPTGGPSDPMGEWSEAWGQVSALSKEQLLASRVAGVRSVNLHNQEWIESRKDKHWMGYNEMCAYLHAQISGEGKSMLNISYDDHYCSFFGKKSSYWTFEASESFLKKAGEKSYVLIDGKGSGYNLSGSIKLEIPAGTGIHNITLVNKKGN